MADWRQIQARIRKAKNSSDAPAKLSELFDRTRDAMVAWELGALEEKAEHTSEAGNWYTIAAQRFRRADWKKKAEEALTRLGLELSAAHEEFQRPDHPIAASESVDTSPQGLQETAPTTVYANETGEIIARRRRCLCTSQRCERERRSYRSNAKKKTPGAPRWPRPPAKRRIDSIEASRPSLRRGAGIAGGRPRAVGSIRGDGRPDRAPGPPLASVRPPAEIEAPTPRLSSERSAQSRAGDPALASRMAQLESMLRRLVTSPAHRLDESDDAPASPGVLLLSDSDQITSYYVESCQTLRIACGNLARAGRGGGKNPRAGRSGYSEGGLKERLGEYLGISEAKASQYMKDHCVIRWIQLDDEAPLLAHFAIGVLRTPLNLE